MRVFGKLTMRSVLGVALGGMLTTSCMTQPPGGRAREFTNPIMSGDWSDPGVIRVGEDYYACRSSFGWQPGIPIAHSQDLIHWRYIGHAFSTLPGLDPGDTRNGVWGLEMGFNPNTKQFVIYAPIRGGPCYVFYSDRPEGPYAVKSLGQGLGIDPGFFADDDGRLYLVLSQAVIYELERDGLSIKREVVRLDRKPYRYFEGPDIFKHGGWYYLLFSDGGTLPHQPSTITTLRARTMEGPWESDPNNPTMFSTDTGAPFQGPAHGTLVETQKGQWFVTYHAHELAFYSLGREMLMEPVEWTADGWWRPVGGKVPTLKATAPDLPACDFALAQSDEFKEAQLGLQWFFTCPPDLNGAAWSLKDKPGSLRIRTQPGDPGSVDALPGIFQQRVIDKRFTFETKVNFDARDGREAAGLHLYHDPLMNLWLVSTVRNGEKRIEVGKYNLGERMDLWSAPNPFGQSVHLRIVVDGQENATFYFSGDGRQWKPIGQSIYFGASGVDLRDGKRGDPDLGWVGRYKDPSATTQEITGPKNPRLPNRMGNIWTATTFGVFAVRDGAPAARDADFDYLRVSKP